MPVKINKRKQKILDLLSHFDSHGRHRKEKRPAKKLDKTHAKRLRSRYEESR